MAFLKLKMQKLASRLIEDRKFLNLSFSQEGEDLILAREFESRTTGFFVDVGAHHPIRFSNTFKFYLRGWRGINIDAMPGSMRPFSSVRPKDINLEIPISNVAGKQLTYFMFNDPALNTFDAALAAERETTSSGIYKMIGKRELETSTLARLLEQNLPAGQAIDFMSIDVEGLDAEVVASNDWARFRPRFVITEGLGLELLDSATTPMNRLMEERGYALWAKTVNSFLYMDRSQKNRI
jgi:FkbM family methyltransferase